MAIELDRSRGWRLAGDLKSPEAAVAAAEIQEALGACGEGQLEIALSCERSRSRSAEPDWPVATAWHRAIARLTSWRRPRARDRSVTRAIVAVWATPLLLARIDSRGL